MIAPSDQASLYGQRLKAGFLTSTATSESGATSNAADRVTLHGTVPIPSTTGTLKRFAARRVTREGNGNVGGRLSQQVYAHI